MSSFSQDVKNSIPEAERFNDNAIAQEADAKRQIEELQREYESLRNQLKASQTATIKVPLERRFDASIDAGGIDSTRASCSSLV